MTATHRTLHSFSHSFLTTPTTRRDLLTCSSKLFSLSWPPWSHSFFPPLLVLGVARTTNSGEYDGAFLTIEISDDLDTGGPLRTVVCREVDHHRLLLPHPRVQTALPLAITGAPSKVAVSHATLLPPTLLLLSAPKVGLGILQSTDAIKRLLPLPHPPPTRLPSLMVVVNGTIIMGTTTNAPLKRAQAPARLAWMHAPSPAWQVIMSASTRPRNSNLVVVARR